jgi:hypothetical protein
MIDHDAHPTFDSRSTVLGGDGHEVVCNPRAVAALQSVLGPGEQLLWCGRPAIRHRKSEAFSGALVALIALALASVGWHNGGVAFFAGLFAVWALWSLGRLVWDRATLAYGVTNRRVLFVHRSWRTSFDDYVLSAMSVAKVEVSDNTVGFANFAQRCGYDKHDICMPAFRGLPDASKVAMLIREAVTAAGEARRPGLDGSRSGYC